MLWNPKFDVPTKVDPLSLEALIAWLKKQPARREYQFGDSSNCLAAQYNASIGREYCPVVLSYHPNATFDEKIERIAVRAPWTFGAALARARSLLTQKAART